MGFILHHAIVVTCWNSKHIEQAHELAVSGGLNPTEITPAVVNGYRSFMIPPDGSKEGWEQSDEGDERRNVWIAAMYEMRHDNYCEWAELSYGLDDGMPKILRASLK